MRGSPYVYRDFRGGINLDADPYLLDDAQARDLRNVQSNVAGRLAKRNGFDQLTLPTDPITSLFGYNSTTDYLVSVEDDGGTTDVVATSTGGTETSIKAGTITAGFKWEFVQAPVSGGQGPVYMVNGQNTPRYWNGSTASTIADWTASAGSVPNGKYMIYHNNRVMIAGVSATPDTLYASQIADPRDWATPNAVTNRFDPEDGEPITGIGPVANYVLVTKPRKLYIVYDTETLAYRKLSDSVGCVSHRSIVQTPVGTFFLSRDSGIYLTNGTSIEKVSTPVDPLLQEISGSDYVDAAGVFYNDSYFLSVSREGSYNDTILEFDTRSASWWIHEIQQSTTVTTGVTDWAILNPEQDASLYAAGAYTTTPVLYHAFKSDQYVDNGTITYPAYWISGWTVLQYPHLRKNVRQLRADAAGDFELSSAKSFATATTLDAADKVVWESAQADEEVSGSDPGLFGVDDSMSGSFGVDDTITYGEGATDPTVIVAPSETRFYTLGTGRAWSFKFENSSELPFELYSYTLHMTFRKD